MFSKFFIERPIFANVIAIVTMILGGVALYKLPIQQFPDIAPPTVQVTTNYPGAKIRTFWAKLVASPIEQQVNGVEGMMYMSSTSAGDGSYTLQITFEVGTNADTAQVLVQNRVAIALPQLPPEVQRQGVVTKKQSTAPVMFISLSSPDGSFDDLFLSNYLTIRVADELSRLQGVGNVNVVPGKDYSMRIWLDPNKLQARGLTTQDVVNALQEQNVQVAAGEIGQPPVPGDQNFQYTVSTLGRLTDPAQFENIVIKSPQDSKTTLGNAGRITRVKDVARVQMGGKTYDQFFQIKGKPAAGIAVYPLPGANTLDVSNLVISKMEELKKAFPEGVVYAVPVNFTKFVSQAISEVYTTLFEAGVLVLLVIMIFLQDWRAVMVPATTIPVTIIGTFAALSLMGFSVNMVTLFGLILAIGIVVDDAIVIVEAVAHNIDVKKMSPKDATILAMSELTGPVLSITVVLMAVFIPAAMLGGITGQLYRQFALTIAASAFISAINALTLKPAQSAAYLRAAPLGKDGQPAKKNVLYRAFNYAYAKTEAGYTRIVGWIVRHTALAMLAFAGLLALTVHLYTALPTGFLPEEDQGYAIVSVMLPDASSQGRTQQAVDKLNAIITRTPGIDDWACVGGNSIFDNATLPNAATIYVVFKDWEERRKDGLSMDVILKNLRGEFAKVQEAMVVAFPPPAILGVGSTAGFQLQILDRADEGLAALQDTTNTLIKAAGNEAGLASLTTTFRADSPQLYADVDRVKVKTMGVPLSDVFGTLQAYLGSAYANDFNIYGRTFQVRVQADQKFRRTVGDIKRLQVRNGKGNMLPLGTAVNIKEIAGPQVLRRYNLYPTAQINGQAAEGFSTGEALKKMEAVADANLPSSMGYRSDRHVLSRTASGRRIVLRVRICGRPCLSGARGVVRELACADGGDLLRAAGTIGRSHGSGMARHGQQRLYPDRHRFNHRVGEQKRHPDRGSRERTARARHEHTGGRGRSRAPPPASNPDDVLRFHPGRFSARQRLRRRRGQPPRAGHGGLRRHDRIDAAGRVSGAGVLRRLAAHQRMAKETGASTGVEQYHERVMTAPQNPCFIAAARALRRASPPAPGVSLPGVVRSSSPMLSSRAPTGHPLRLKKKIRFAMIAH